MLYFIWVYGSLAEPVELANHLSRANVRLLRFVRRQNKKTNRILHELQLWNFIPQYRFHFGHLLLRGHDTKKTKNETTNSIQLTLAEQSNRYFVKSRWAKQVNSGRKISHLILYIFRIVILIHNSNNLKTRNKARQ